MQVIIGAFGGGPISGLYQSCCIFTVGELIREVKVDAALLQVMACVCGITVLVGAIVLIPIVTMAVSLHPVDGSVAVKVSESGLEIVTVCVFAVKDGLVQLYVSGPKV